jgi:hypothetical protein
MSDTKTELPIHFDYIEKAEQLTFEWTKDNNIKLFKIEFIVPFVLTDISLQVWLFFDTDKTMSEYETNGTTQLVKQKYLDCLTQLDYPENYLNEVNFTIDSDENVQKNYEGSYFYRLR